MEIPARNRADLKSYFVKNSIPTESNFGELIDGMLNQMDDGIVKLPGSPLSIEAVGDTNSPKNLINIYQSFQDQNPAWTFNLNPRTDTNDVGTARLGFNISDGEGNSRLFIDRNNGNVGIGTTSPQAKLHVSGSNSLRIENREGEADILMIGGTGQGWQVGTGRGPVDDGKGFYVHSNERNTSDLVVRATDGNVGIGTTSPAVRLDVHGQTILGSDKSSFWHHNPYGDAIGEPTASIGRLEVGGFDDGSGTVPAILRLHQWGSGAAEFYKPRGQTLILRETPGGGGGAFNKFSIMDADVGIGTTEPEAKLHVDGDFLLQGSQGVLIRSGSFGSSNHSSGNTRDQWIKLGEFVIDGNWNAAGADWEIYPGNRSLGDRRQRVAVHARNNNSDVEGVNVQLLNLDSGNAPAIKDVKVVRKSGSGTGQNIMAVWVQMGSPWLGGQNAFTVHYYGTWNEISLETSPQFDTIQDSGTQYEINTWFGANRSDGGWHFMNGNVGIGTTSPEEGLHVNGSVRGNQDGALRIDSGNGTVDVGAKNSLWAHFYTDRPRFYFDKGLSVNAGLIGSYDGDLSLQTSGATRVSVLNSNGNVGIGTTSPVKKLDVIGEVVADGFSLSRNSGDRGVLWLATTGDFNHALYNNYSNVDGEGRFDGAKWNVYLGLDIRGGVDHKSAMFIHGAGNVGIGTTSPVKKLDVIGEVVADGFSLSRNSGDRGVLWLATTGDFNHALYNNYSNVDGEGRFDGAKWNVYEGLDIRVAIGHESAMFISQTGNVGIGTTSPQAKLHVTGANKLRIENSEGEADFLMIGGSGQGWQVGTGWGPADGGKGFYVYSNERGSGDLVVRATDGNVGIGTADPRAKLTVNGPVIWAVVVATGLGPNDETDNGQVVSRVLNFAKLYDDTAIRITYCDNFRIIGDVVASRWEIRVNGLAPPGGGIYQDKYASTGNFHAPATIMGFASGLAAGNHQIQIWVGPTPGYAVNNAYTGWNNSRWTIEAQEVWVQDGAPHPISTPHP